MSSAHPYSPALAVGDLGFVSGALSVDADGAAVPRRSEALTAAMDRLIERLATVGMGLADVVKTTYFVTDVSLREEANAQVFAEPRPARSFVEVAALPYGATVEIEAIGPPGPSALTRAGRRPDRDRSGDIAAAQPKGSAVTEQTTTAPTTDLEALIDSCIASRDTRYEDWDTLGFQAAKGGDRFKRAQIRYIGSGATGDHSTDTRTLPSEHFTFSNMRLPAGAVGPEHTHHDVEEVFFVLEGTLEVAVHDVEDGTRVAKRVLGYRDLIRVPAGVPRSLTNVGNTDALMCVIIGTQKPQLPTYPPTSEMYGVTR